MHTETIFERDVVCKVEIRLIFKMLSLFVGLPMKEQRNNKSECAEIMRFSAIVVAIVSARLGSRK